jgi:hypothetical protein
MKKALVKSLVKRAQAQRARIDYLTIGRPQRSSKTYLEAFAYAYAQGEGHVHYEWSAF